MTPALWTRIALALLLGGSGWAAVSPDPSAVLVGTLGIAVGIVVANLREDSPALAGVWGALGVATAVGTAILRRGPEASLVADVVQLGAIPVLLAVLAHQGWALRRRLSGALATSEVARAKLLRSNSELARAADETEAALAKLGALVENLAEGLVAVTLDGEIELANPSLARLLSVRRIEVGSRAADVLPDGVRELIAVCLEAREVAVEEFPLEGGIGQAVASPVERQGELWGAVVLVRDITLQKEIDRMKSDFIAVVSHEMRTPLTSVIGFTRIIGNQLEKRVFPAISEDDARGLRARDKIRGNLDVIRLEGERLSTLITDVLDLAKMESGQVEWSFAPQDPAQLVRDAVRATEPLFAERDGVRVLLEIDGDLPPIEGDRGRLLQVLINLLGNALKFTEHGTVTASAKALHDAVEFSIADTGVGIRPADKDLVFDKFRQVGDTLTNRPNGTGLGLPICREIVQQHGGYIGVESEVDVGSRFFFSIPVTGSAARA